MKRVTLNILTLLLMSVLLFNGCSGGDGGGEDNSTDDQITTEKTVIDSVTKFEWQDFSEYDDNYNYTNRNWQESISYCENLTYAEKSDWFLPSIELLSTIVDSSKTPTESKGTVVDGFENILPFHYWSSSIMQGSDDWSENRRLLINFGTATIEDSDKNDGYLALCVRGGNFTDSTLYGRWAYVDTSEIINIDIHTYFKEYELIDENLIKVGSRYLIRAGIADVKLNGELATISSASSLAISRKRSSSIGNMNIILKNIKQNKEVSVKIEITDDASKVGKILNGTLYVANPNLTGGRIIIPKNSDLTMPTGATEITLKDLNNSAKFTVNVVGQETDLGILTVTDKPYNFKSYIENGNDWKYFGYNDGESEISYTKTLKICNIGTESISGVSFELDINASDILRDFTSDYDGSAVPFSSGECKSYESSFSFKRPVEDKDIKINITINDNFNSLTWNDYTTLKLSQYSHHNLYFNSNTKELNGYLVAPGREIINVEFSSSSSNNYVRVPLVQTDEYDVLISASDINDEDVYMISSGVEADTTKMNGFTDVTANEPDNNESSATRLSLFEGEAVAYIQQGDIDFYKIVDIPYSSRIVAKDYYVDLNISIPMTTELNSSSITTDTIKVTSTTGAVLGDTVYNSDKNIFIFQPSLNFTTGAYTVTLNKNLQSATGFKLETDMSFDVEVEAYPSGAQIIYSDNDVFAMVNALSISGDFIYLADSLSGLSILDITSPIKPISRGDFQSNARTVTASGNYAYMVDNDARLQIIDISNPSTPILKSTYFTSGGDVNIVISGDYAYLADNWAGLQIIDISNPSLPTLKGSLPNSNGADIALIGNYAYIGLQIIDISNPTSPTLIKTLEYAEDIAISGNYAYIVNSEQVFKIYDISNPTSPTVKGSLSISNHIEDIAISGDYAFIVGEFGLKVIDISTPTSPILQETIDIAGGAWNISISGNFAYVSHPHEGGLKIINIQMYK